MVLPFQPKPYYQSCGGKFCSPRSGRCYNWLGKPYYLTCGTSPPVNQNCCSRCGGSAFCSPRSGRCYPWQAKSYYQSCRVFASSAETNTNGSDESEFKEDAAEELAETAMFYP